MAGKRPWTPEEDAYLRDHVLRGVTTKAIAAAMNRGHSSVATKIEREGLTNIRDKIRRGESPIVPLPAVPVSPIAAFTPPDPVVVERERMARVARLKEEKDLLTAVASERSLRSYLEQLASKTATEFRAPAPYRPPAVPRTAKPTVTTAVQLLSDFHAGEVVSGDGMRGFNAYDRDVFRERLTRIVDAHLLVKEQRERGGGYIHEELVVPLVGDFISGTIHELERHGDHDNVVWAVYDCAMALAEAIERMAATYPAVRLYATSGNHGRFPDARRVQQKDPTRNWDCLIYLLAREHLRLNNRLTWIIPNSYSAAWEVYGWRFLQTHGHDVKSWNSIPWYGLNRLVGNINALESGRGTPIHYWLFAHFHNASSLPHATGESFVNGSLIGGTEFTLNALGKSDRPSQWLLFVHRELGLTTRELLFAAQPLGAAA